MVFFKWLTMKKARSKLVLTQYYLLCYTLHDFYTLFILLAELSAGHTICNATLWRKTVVIS